MKDDFEQRFFDVLGLKRPCKWREKLHKQASEPAVSEKFWGVPEEKPDVYEWPESEIN